MKIIGLLCIIAGVILVFSLNLGIDVGPDTFGIATSGDIPGNLSLTTIIGGVLILIGIVLLLAGRRYRR